MNKRTATQPTVPANGIDTPFFVVVIPHGTTASATAQVETPESNGDSGANLSPLCADSTELLRELGKLGVAAYLQTKKVGKKQVVQLSVCRNQDVSFEGAMPALQKVIRLVTARSDHQDGY